MQTYRRVLCTVLMVLLVAAVSGAAVADEAYDVWINGERFTDQHVTVTCGEGTATLDVTADPPTLTLRNITASQAAAGQYGIINSGLPALTIVLEGENLLNGQNGNNDGIDADGGCSIAITGSGSLTIEQAYYGTYIGYYEIPGGDLTIDGGATVTVDEPAAAGLWVNHDITFDDCTVTVTKTGANYNGIVSNVGGTVTVNNGSNVTVRSVASALHFGNTDDSQHALVVNGGNFSLTSTYAPAQGEEPDGRKGYGIYVEPYVDGEGVQQYFGTITVNGGTLAINAGTAGTNLPASAVTLGQNVAFTEGTSLSESGITTVTGSAAGQIITTIGLTDVTATFPAGQPVPFTGQVAAELREQMTLVDEQWVNAQTGAVAKKGDGESSVPAGRYVYTVILQAVDGWQFGEIAQVTVNGIQTDLDGVTFTPESDGKRITVSGLLENTADELPLRGDLNADKTVNAKDALLVLKYAVGKIDFTPVQQLAADLNDDTDVNAKDALIILKIAVHKL